MMYFQTGDVLYKKSDAVPAKAKRLKGNVVHKGDTHLHTIRGKFELLEHEGKMFINALGKCKLEHPEHKTVELPKGVYLKDIVLEYDHFLEESRQVID